MFSKYLNSIFFKNLVILTGASGLSQLIPFLVLPILQKYFYSPENFGTLSIYVSISLMLVKFSTFSYEFAIVKQKEEKNALSIVFGTSQILIASTLLIGIVISILYLFFKDNFYVVELNYYIFLIPVTVLSFGFYQILKYWYNWKKDYKGIGSSLILKSIGAESSKLIQGFYALTSYGLVVGRVIGELFSFLTLLIPFINNDYKKLVNIPQSEIRKLLKINYKFPLFTMPSALKGTLLNVIFITLFADYFGLSNAGIIGISVSYVSAAFEIISQSFSQVFYKKISELQDSELLSTLKKNVLILFCLSALVVIIIINIPNHWVVNLLGQQWENMMPVLKTLIYYISLLFISSSVSFIYIRTNRQKEMLFVDICHLILVSSAIIIGYHLTKDFMQTLIVYVIAQSLYYSFAIFLSFYFAKKLS